MLEEYMSQQFTKLSVVRDASGDTVRDVSGDVSLNCMFRSITPLMIQQHMELAGFQGMAWFAPGAAIAVGDYGIGPDSLYYRIGSLTLAERRLGESGVTQFRKCLLNSVKEIPTS